MEANEYKDTGIISIDSLKSILLSENVVLQRAGHPDAYLRLSNGDMYLCPVADSTRDGIQRIVTARKKQLAKWSVEHDSGCHGEPLLTAVVQDLLTNHSDGLGISRKYPDRNDRLAIAGALIAAILDIRIAEAKKAEERATTVQQNRNKNISAKLVALYTQVIDDGHFTDNQCWCGSAALYKVSDAKLDPDTNSLHIKYECPNCGLRGERKWMV
ncbi:MAG: hypothetical protein WC261_08280 [Synergistaceae bacterium]|jgi:hypothetical protein